MRHGEGEGGPCPEGRWRPHARADTGLLEALGLACTQLAAADRKGWWELSRNLAGDVLRTGGHDASGRGCLFPLPGSRKALA